MAVERAGQEASAPIQALIRAGQELAENRPLADLFPFILDLAIQAVNAQRGVLLILRRRHGWFPRARKGRSFRISHRVRESVLNEKSSILVPERTRSARRLQGRA